MTRPAMDQRTPRIPDLLSQDDLLSIHGAAVALLDQVGLRVDDDRVVDRLAGRRGVRLEGGRLRLAPELVESHTEALRAAHSSAGSKTPASRIRLSAGCCASHIVDSDTLGVRPVVFADLVYAARLIDSLRDEAISGAVPGFPQDIAPDLRALAEYMIGSKHIRTGGGFVAPCSIAALEFIREMHRAMEQPFSLPLYVISPLRIAGDSLDAILHFGDHLTHVSVSSMPVMGVTAPVEFVGAFVQAIAEALGGSLVVGMLLPDVPVSIDIMAYCADMARGTIVYGSPEQNLCDMLRMPINAFYGNGQVSTRSIRTTAQRPGVQACAEKAASAACGALAGSRRFSGAGMLSVDEIWSPEQLVIDREIADYAQRLVSGVSFGDPMQSVELIAEGASTGEYLSHRNTLDSFRGVYWNPRMFRHAMLQEWQARGEREAWQEARSIIRQRLAAPGYELERGKSRELDRIYERAEQVLV
jgi:trimethylamine--corrinoid protein Co-methyltransferase